MSQREKTATIMHIEFRSVKSFELTFCCPNGEANK